MNDTPRTRNDDALGQLASEDYARANAAATSSVTARTGHVVTGSAADLGTPPHDGTAVRKGGGQVSASVPDHPSQLRYNRARALDLAIAARLNPDDFDSLVAGADAIAKYIQEGTGAKIRTPVEREPATPQDDGAIPIAARKGGPSTLPNDVDLELSFQQESTDLFVSVRRDVIGAAMYAVRFYAGANSETYKALRAAVGLSN